MSEILTMRFEPCCISLWLPLTFKRDVQNSNSNFSAGTDFLLVSAIIYGKWNGKTTLYLLKNCYPSASIWHIILWLRQMLKLHYPVPHQYLNFPAGVWWVVLWGLCMAKSASRWISVLLQCPEEIQRLVSTRVLGSTVGNSYSPVRKWSIWISLV